MIICITQARISSSRFPGKVLQDIEGMKLLELHLKRVKKSKLIDKIVVAVADEVGADIIEEISAACGAISSRGPVSDVLARFFNAGTPFSPDLVVRLTSDCPLIDSKIIDEVIELQRFTGADYVSNVHPPTYPDGLDVEVMKWSALSEAASESISQEEREHVTPFIWTRPHRYIIENLSSSVDYSSLRLTVDYPEDIEVIRSLVRDLGPFEDYKAYVDLLDNSPDIQLLNQRRIRNESFRK